MTVSSQLEMAEKNFRSIGREDDIFQNRMRNFNRGVSTPDVPGEEVDLIEEEGMVWEVEVKDQSRKIELPKIATKASKMPESFGMELNLHKQYDKKYNIQRQCRTCRGKSKASPGS